MRVSADEMVAAQANFEKLMSKIQRPISTV